MHPLKRLPLLLLVPHLLVLGMVTGACFCLESDGETHLRALAETCCASNAAVSASRSGGMSAENQGDDCGSCRDITLAADLGTSWSPERWESLGELLGGFGASELIVAPALASAPSRRVKLVLDAAPSVATLLRGVVMTC